MDSEKIIFRCNIGRFKEDVILQNDMQPFTPIVFNEGTENECIVEYVTWSRIMGDPIFLMINGEKKNVESGVSWYIGDRKIESKEIVFIEYNKERIDLFRKDLKKGTYKKIFEKLWYENIGSNSRK